MIAKTIVALLSFFLPSCAIAEMSIQDELSTARTEWIGTLLSKQVEAAVALYTPDADFLDPSGARIHGASELLTLYKTVTSTFDASCHLWSRTAEVSGDLAFDRGECDEDITVRATGAKNHFKGSYLTVYRRVAGRWLIVQQAWTEMKPQ
jgi:ketosteroid isomerase-like protein